MKKTVDLAERDNLIKIYQNEHEKQKSKEFEQISDLEKKAHMNPFINEVLIDSKKCVEKKCDENKDALKRMKAIIDYINNVCDSGLIKKEERLSLLQQEKKRIQKEIRKLEKKIERNTKKKE